MLGSTFIYEKNKNKLLVADLEILRNLISVDLDKMMSIDFVTLLLDSEVDWVEKEPVFSDPEKGIAIAKVNSNGLKYILTHSKKTDISFINDLKKLLEFINAHGFENIYELSVF